MSNDAGCAMQFSILGTLKISVGGESIDTGGLNQRAVLAYLLLNANTVVPTSRILNALWDGAPPATARKMVQNSVSAIRKTITRQADRARPPEVRTQPPGYLLSIDHDSVDIHRFRHGVGLARADLASGQALAARNKLRQSLSLWYGRALADLVEVGTAWSELSAIEDERISAYEDCFDAELACGRHREITPELEMLTKAEPMRERLGQQYMVALYRSGRQVEALDIFRRTRAALREGLGIEPGPALQQQHRLILEHDSSLQFGSAHSAG